MKSRRKLPLLALLAWVLVGPSACAPAPAQEGLAVINVYATSAAYPWLSTVYDCAPSGAAIRLTDPAAAAVQLRLGEPAALTMPAFQVGSADLLVVVHPQSGIGSLSRDQVQALFAGQVSNWKDVGGSDLPVQVWAYDASEDIQAYFAAAVMAGRPVTSLARLAVSAQAMSDSVGSVPGSIGLLPRRWKTGNTREALQISTLPVLAILNSRPKGPVRDLLSCVQLADQGSH